MSHGSKTVSVSSRFQFKQHITKFQSFKGELQYLALNDQSSEEARAPRALSLLSCLFGSGFTAVVLLIRPQAPLTLLQRLSLLCGVVGRALALLLSVGMSVLRVGQWGADPGTGVLGLPPQPRDVPLQQAALDDAVGLLKGTERRNGVKWLFLIFDIIFFCFGA